MPETSPLQLVQEILRDLTGALSSAALYTLEHPKVVEHLGKLVDDFRLYSSYEQELLIACVDDELLYQGKPLVKSPYTLRLLSYCSRQGIGFIKLSQGFSLRELQQLIRVLMGKQSLDAISSLTSYIQIGSAAVPHKDTRPIARFDELTDDEKNGLQQQFDHIADKQAFDVEQIATMVAGFISAFRREANPFLALVPIRDQDEYTFTHSVDVGILNIAQGMALGIEGQILHDVGIAGMLHDVGKIFVAKEILTKPATLTEEEFAVIKQHPARGTQYLMNQQGIPQLAIITAYEHHMRYDLAGYPRVDPDWRLNICSQMTMISDTFDALRTCRAYKSPLDFSKTSGLMFKLAGSQLNPDLTLNFLRTLAVMGEDMASFDDSPEDEQARNEILSCSCSLKNSRCE